jgi:asparagine synthetase B (glutamine-hydrolysing)
MQSDYLRKADMMSMINQVEFRVPMLDEDLVAHSLSIPYSQKSTFFRQKKILRGLHQRIFPPETSQLQKRGFSIPLDAWLGEKNLSAIKEYLLMKDGLVLRYVETSYVDTLFGMITSQGGSQNKYCSRASAYQRVLILYSLQLWFYEKYNKHRWLQGVLIEK